MATWSLYTSEISGGDLTQSFIVVLGNSLFYKTDISGANGVKQYNKDTDTIQTVLTPATVGVTGVFDLAVFNGTLYASAYSASNTTEVWQYSGTPENWTRVLAKNNTVINSADMMCNDDYIVCVERAYVGGVWVSTDGSSWSAASTVPVNNYIDGLGNAPRYYSLLPLTFQADYASGDVPTDWRTSQLTGADTVAVIADYSVHRANVQNEDYLWFDNSSTGDYEYSSDGSSFTASPDGSTTYPVTSQNMPYSVGGRAGSATVYYFIGGAWVSQGTLGANGVDKAFRFSDGTVMAVDGTSGGLYASDEPVTVAGPYDLTHSAGSIPGSILVAAA